LLFNESLSQPLNPTPITTNQVEVDKHPKSKIGILDSGVGGLSVLLEINKLIPYASIEYIGDSSWCPYGSKSSNQIQERVISLSKELINKGVDIIVIACNSATIHAVETVREQFSIPFIGMEPAVKPAAQATQSNVIGILATEASIAGEKFHHLIHTHAPPSKIKVITQPCPKFVELVEKGTLAGTDVNEAINEYTKAMLSSNVDTLVLGCTHYPFLRNTIQQQVGNTIKLIDTGAAVAKRTLSLLPNSPLHTPHSPPSINIQTTGNLSLLEDIFPLLCPELQSKAQITLSHLPL